MDDMGEVIAEYELSDFGMKRAKGAFIFVIASSTFTVCCAIAYKSYLEETMSYLPYLIPAILMAIFAILFLNVTTPELKTITIRKNGIQLQYGPRPIHSKMHDLYIPFNKVKGMSRTKDGSLKVKYYATFLLIKPQYAEFVEQSYANNNKL